MNQKLAIIGIIVVVVMAVIFTLTNSSKNNTTPNQSENMTNTTIQLTSSAFEDGGVIPSKYTCDGDNINPPLSIENTAEQAETLVLIMEDPDVPAEIREDQMFDHWVVFNIPSTTTEIMEGAGVEGTAGRNTAGNTEYVGPCPPTQYEPTEHRYIFTISALDTTLDLEEGATKQEVRAVMEGHIIEETTLTGRYDRVE